MNFPTILFWGFFVLPKDFLKKADLLELYVKRDLNMKECAKVLGCHWTTVSKYLEIHGIKKVVKFRRDDCGRWITKGQILPPVPTGKDHHLFVNGVGIYRKVAERYHPKRCFHCHSTKNLQVHHIDRNRENNNWWNLRFVCQGCHMRIEHTDRLHRRDEKGRFF
jgi:hypothetical protein